MYDKIYFFTFFLKKKKNNCNLVTEQKEKKKKKEIFLKIQGWEAEHLGLNSESILIWHQNLEMSAKWQEWKPAQSYSPTWEAFWKTV